MNLKPIAGIIALFLYSPAKLPSPEAAGHEPFTALPVRYANVRSIVKNLSGDNDAPAVAQ